MNAAKDRMDPNAAMALAREHSKVIVAKGKKVLTFEMKKEPDEEALQKAMIGPSGWLRAPTFRRGKTLVVGFHQDAYDELFG